MSKKHKICRGITLLVVIGVMATIYSLSDQPAVQSDQLSSHFTEGFKQAVEAVSVLPINVKVSLMGRASFYVRKLAHAWIYALLGGTVLMALWQSALKKGRCIILAWVISSFYAMTDEWHQLYVAGRSGELRDVMLDSTGALIGILVTYLLLVMIRQIRLRIKE